MNRLPWQRADQPVRPSDPVRPPEPLPPRREPARVFAYAAGLATVATGSLLALLAAGAGWPPVLPVLVFAALLALTVARAALYPNELAITTESALLLGAIVVFRDDAPFTGPLVLALLVGLLDRVHWEQRAFVKMAYNGGSRGLTALGVATAFAGATAVLGEAVAAALVSVVIAAVVAAALDLAFAVGLDACRGRPVGAGWREVVEIDALDLPLAVVGGAVGFLATGIGWWAAIGPLVGLALAPELLQVRARVPTLVLRNALLGVELVAALGIVAVFFEPPPAATICLLAAIAIAVGVDLVVDTQVPVPPVLGVVVVMSVVAVGDGPGVFAGALVAAVATAVSWWSSPSRAPGQVVFAVAAAAGAGVLAALVVHAEEYEAVLVALLGLVAAVGFGLVVLVGARGRRRIEAANLVWTVPLAAVVLGGPYVDGLGADGSLLAAFAVLVAVVGLAACCGSTPWRSRIVSRVLGSVRGKGRRIVFLGLCGVVMGLSVAAVTVGASRAEWLGWGAFVAGEGAIAMAMFATRQWCFSPTARTQRSALLVVAALAAPVVVTPGLRDGQVWALAPVIVLMMTGVAAGWRSVRLGDAVTKLAAR